MSNSPPADATGSDGEPATWCRVLAVGPPCPHPCVDCRRTPMTMDALRAMHPDNDPTAAPHPQENDHDA